ncbi:hypothetical protein [Hymenobacter sp. BT491]|uniref:hypothetical protein n=1 Tax=Hymenobacter sp. BT491 TaxID=2766779 RepID=UPI0013FD0531|nr:hypothetical protein [Hymenobacter sp. BT491]MBC6988149.1 hypothetical protein [Hymenobacter sp. BT491]
MRALAEFIEKERVNASPADRAAVINALGCFLGECIVRSFGGQWNRDTAGVVGVQLGAGTFINPFWYVERQWLYKLSDVITGLYASIPLRVAGGEEPRRRRTWIPVPLPPQRIVAT